MKYYWYYYLDGEIVSTAPVKDSDGIIGSLGSARIRHVKSSTEAHSPIPAVLRKPRWRLENSIIGGEADGKMPQYKNPGNPRPLSGAVGLAPLGCPKKIW